jgi:hypothetical protein
MRYTYRIGGCYALATGGDSAGCRPTDNISAPLVGSMGRLEELARGVLNSPTSSSPGYEWRSKSITTTGFRRFRERDTLPIEHLGEKVIGVIVGPVKISQNSPTEFTQSFTVWYVSIK